MCLSSSQARALLITQRISDVEYEAQQINQQRLNLSREASDLTNQMMNLEVPTPPQVSAYVETVYCGAIGATQFEIASVVPNDGLYNLNLRFQETSHYLEEIGNAEIVDNGDGTFSVRNGDDTYPIYNYRDQLGQMISTTSDEGYLSAFMNYFPAEFTEQQYQQDPDLLRDKISVYFTTPAGSTVPRVHFMLTTDVENMLPDATSGWATVYDYIPNGQHDAYHQYEECGVNFGSDGRIVSVELPTQDGRHITYPITYQTRTNEEAYNDAYQAYVYKKDQYDHKIDEINKKTELMQRQDKQLETMLKDLDTSRNALSTELEAVNKCLQDAIEKGGFKTFNG